MFGVALSVKSRAYACTPALFNQVIDDPHTASVCADISDALERVRRGEMSREDFETYKSRQKKLLPVFTPHASYRDGRRQNDEAIPSGLSMYDIDHISDPRGYFQRIVAERCGELGIPFAHVTPSTEGLRLFFVVPEGMSLAEAQKWMSEQLGDENYDGKVKDLARSSFVVPRDYVLYLDEEELFKDRQVTWDIRQGTHHAPAPPSAAPSRTEAPATPSGEPPSDGQGSASARNLRAFDLCLKEAGLSRAKIDKVGIYDWHNSLLSVLSVGLSRLMPQQDLLAVLRVRMPNYSKEDDCRRLVSDFYNGYTKPNATMTATLRKIYAATLREGQGAEEDEAEADGGEVVPFGKSPMPVRRFPPGLRESMIGIPENMQMPVLCSLMPLLGALADGVEVKYCDGSIQYLALMAIIVGEQASGKSSCKRVIDVWKQQLDEEDAAAMKIEEEVNRRRLARKANERAPEDPRVLIRVVPITISCAKLLQRMKNARGHTLYSFCEELDTLRKTNTGGSWAAKYDIYRTAFDHGEWGQDYKSDTSESGKVDVCYNWSILGTYGAVRRCFRSENIENGLSGRMLMAEMPDSAFAPMPQYRSRSADDDAQIQEAVKRLRGTTGFVDTPRLRKAIWQWSEDMRVESLKNIDAVMDTYRRRAAAIGFRCGVIFHLLTGKKHESATTIEFALMMARYCLDEQMRIFGEEFRNLTIDARAECVRYGSNHSVFDQLPNTFTRDDLRALKQGKCTEANVRKIISSWRKSGWIEDVDRQHMRKRNLGALSAA